MNLNSIYLLAEQSEVTVDCFDMNDIGALSCRNNDGYFIAIDPFKLDSTREEKVRLAHELGHCATDSFYNKESIADVRSRHEYRADRWAVEQLIPWEEMKEALDNGIIDVWELADHFDVTEEFIDTAIMVYKRRGKLSY
ncbi:MAG: ImmA/IrrE family metallo-endopeptidase [Oscillospiraceae bacterium]